MGFLSHLFWPWGVLLQVLAIVHFIRRRPDQVWIWVILFLGPIGAVVYISVEVIPDIGLLRGSFKLLPRRKRIGELRAMVQQNPSVGNWEELGDLLMEDGKTAPHARPSIAPLRREAIRLTPSTVAVSVLSSSETQRLLCPISSE